MMTQSPTIMDFLPAAPSIAKSAGHAAVCAAPDTPDADLYRILVGHALSEGRFNTKIEFDDHVRALSTVAQADAVIAFRKLRRSDCEVWRRGDLMVCECGVHWKLDAVDPPHCKKPYAK